MQIFMASNMIPLSLFISSIILLPFCSSQASSTPAQDSCTGIFLSYLYKDGARIRPFLSNPARQPYSFSSTATILNAGDEPLRSWNLFIGFQHDEVLVSSSPAVLTDGTTLPARVGNGTFFSGFPNRDLKTAIETAGDINSFQVEIELVGTQFGVRPPNVPLLSNLSLANEGYTCPPPTQQGANLMHVCCKRDLSLKDTIAEDEGFRPRKSGDITIAYDVLQAHEGNYLALVTIQNHNPLHRLDNWKLKWEWAREEFIYDMKGAHTTVKDASDCIFGEQGNYYKDFDFSPVLNCQRSPTIVDLPLSKANDTDVGLIPSCCRNGTLLPPSMDPSKSISAFQLQVYKMPPHLNRTQLFPPRNWKISDGGSTLNQDYHCGPPDRVSASRFPDSVGLASATSAVVSWQVVCNLSRLEDAKPRCCVSFSAFYNDSVVPCPTCACGCPFTAGPNNTCNSQAPALLLPSQSLLVPFANRTAQALKWADMRRSAVPELLPCGDNCGVSINWHVLTDYRKGWTARMTLFNWDKNSVADWFAAVQLDEAVFPGYEAVYSFNGSALPDMNNTIFMRGLPGQDFLVAEADGHHPSRDPRIPGKQQTVISFSKKTTPGIDVAGGHGFPSKVFFNGEECSLPLTVPSAGGNRTGTFQSVLLSLIFAVAALLALMEL